MPSANAASSSFHVMPRFSKGDLDEVMSSMRPLDVAELWRSIPNLDVPFFPFPVDDPGMDVPGGKTRGRSMPGELN